MREEENPKTLSKNSKGSADHAELCANTDASHTCTKFSHFFLLADIFLFDANERICFCFQPCINLKCEDDLTFCQLITDPV